MRTKSLPRSNLIRSTEALRHAKLSSLCLRKTAIILLLNPAAISTFGPERPLTKWFDDPVSKRTPGLRWPKTKVYRAEASSCIGSQRFYMIEEPPRFPILSRGSGIFLSICSMTLQHAAEQETVAETKGRLVNELQHARWWKPQRKVPSALLPFSHWRRC